eukprot:GDKI01032106.1.p1 GENE.GDKI01032106.1~~GDKI01032106.1.p1  ORF type:complete len:490 (+),score=124.36 GDKI01032106.1:157-1470(+)
MGSCMSKSNSTGKQNMGNTTGQPASPGGAQNQRRRLSVSQSAQAKDTDAPRGFINFIEKNENVLPVFAEKSKDELKPGAPNGGGRRMSLSGIVGDNQQRGFENKHFDREGDFNLVDMGLGYACKKGLKPESPNQDDFFILRIDDWGLYGVFDGHGPYGHDISNFCQQHVPRLLVQNPDFVTKPKEALKAAFLEVHKMLENESMKGKFDCSLSGSTGTVILHRSKDQKLYVAHVGDSRAVLAQKGPDGKLTAFDLTNDHKPNLEHEKRRIHASGGQVRRLEGDIPYRVFLKGKLYPGLAMSRALGDTVGVSAGVIPEPEVNEVSLSENRDIFVVMCSDGVWEFIQSQEAVDMVNKYPKAQVQEAAESLAAESWSRWISEEGNVVDDITAQIIYLYPPVSHVPHSPKTWDANMTGAAEPRRAISVQGSANGSTHTPPPN